MQNKFFAIGRWTKDHQMKHTQNDVSILNNTIAINDRFNKDDTTFLPVVMFKRVAENTESYTGKGSLVSIEGRIQVRSWEQDGQKRYSTEVLAENVQFLEKPDRSRNGGDQHKETNSDFDPEDPFKDDGNPIDVKDDDLPF